MSNTAIVDERAMQYSGSWTDAGAFIEFSGTTRWSSAQGSTAKYTFQGTQITVYGTVAPNSPSASMSFGVDSFTGSYSSTSAGGAVLYHEALWTSPPLSDGQHTLVVTQDEAQASGVIFLDYLLYQTSSSAPGTVYFVDDRDSRISYSPAWRQFNGTQGDFMHTSSESTNVGDSFTFEFEGTAIEYYGGLTTSDTGKTIASMVLDGADPVPYTAPSSLPGTTNSQIFNATNLAPGTHKLVVTSADTATLWADYFLVTPNVDASGDPSPSPGTTTSSSSSSFTSTIPGSGGATSSNPSASAHSSSGTSSISPLGGSGQSTVVGGSRQSTIVSGSSIPSASNTNGPSSQPVSNSTPHSVPTAAIAAGTVGGVIFVLLLLLAACILIRHRRRRAHDHGHISHASVPRPFGLSSTPFEYSPWRKNRDATPAVAVASTSSGSGSGSRSDEKRTTVSSSESPTTPVAATDHSMRTESIFDSIPPPQYSA